MINKVFEEIGSADIEALISESVKENRSLEYKEKLPSGNDRDKISFLSDVSAFANTNGGDIIYGMREKRIDNKPSGIPEEIIGLSVTNKDTEIGRLVNVLINGLEPKIAEPRLKFIPTGSCEVLLVRIQSSWRKPHMITLSTSSPRFYIRTDHGNHPLDVHEIRSAFALSESMGEKLRRFRDERLATLLSDEGPAHIDDGPFLIVHVVPAGALDQRTRIDLKLDGLGMIEPITGGGYSSRLNFDGRLHNSYAMKSAMRMHKFFDPEHSNFTIQTV